MSVINHTGCKCKWVRRKLLFMFLYFLSTASSFILYHSKFLQCHLEQDILVSNNLYRDGQKKMRSRLREFGLTVRGIRDAGSNNLGNTF